MGAVYKKEIKSYFSTPIGYIFMAVVTLLSGVGFFTTNILQSTAELSSFFTYFQEIIIFIIPILTMRIWADEKRNKTDQALLTAPVGLWKIALGKFFAALTVYLSAAAITVVYGLTLATVSDGVDGLVLVGNIFGMLLVGAAMIAIGMFISNLTESQVVAAVVTFGVALLIVMIQTVAALTPAWLASILVEASLFTRYQDFAVGILSYADILFYLSIAFIFIFLTVRTLEKRRWS